MRRLARTTIGVVILLAVVGARPAGAQNDEAKAAEQVVMRQLQAFREDDYDMAYTFAATVIRQAFDRAAFERMVRTGYPEIARSAHAAVEKHETTVDDRRYITLRILGANGVRIVAIYELIREGADWRISGVVTRPVGETV
jgi:Domain of unknown function (DUF4864)